jgi:hypothetical protein
VAVIIYVVDPTGESEFIGSSLDELITNLSETADDEYAGKVLNWFAEDHSQPFEIRNGKQTEVWHVI